MRMEDVQRVPAPQAKVWAALNDPGILKACIPGYEKLEMTSPTDMTATAAVAVRHSCGGHRVFSRLVKCFRLRFRGRHDGVGPLITWIRTKLFEAGRRTSISIRTSRLRRLTQRRGLINSNVKAMAQLIGRLRLRHSFQLGRRPRRRAVFVAIRHSLS
jgi:carbon monoxide dehydrogenase subunit G